MDKKIIIKLDGRMGNQMFQWALARAYEAQNGILPEIDNSKETLKLGCFKLIRDIKTVKKPIWNIILRKTVPFRNLRNKWTEMKFDLPVVKEDAFSKYTPSVLEAQAPAYLTGFFQTEKYFVEVREQLLEDFTLNKELNKKNKILLEEIKTTNSVSIHFRRGDYLKQRVANSIGNIKEQYYHDAIKLISAKTKNDLTLFVFSDDINWVKNNVQFGHKTVYVNINSAKQGYFDLELMKNCKHNIIANSSFSWWGAWLNENPEKIVVAPSPIRPNGKDFDFIPTSWNTCNSYMEVIK